MKAKLIVFLLIAGTSVSFAQMGDYDHKRELQGDSALWHKIVLPDGVFGKTKDNLSDIRVFGITENGDTIEAPYLLEIDKGKTESKDVNFKLINQSRDKRGYYFTFELPAEKAINQIKLDMGRQNFDWRINLEGSHDQRQWFNILENYRILSIKNKQTEYRFTKLAFPNSRYRFFRLFINSHEKPALKTASLSLREATEGNYRDYTLSLTRIAEDKRNKKTEVFAKLPLPVPISSLKINIGDTMDYYRPFTVEYLADSFKTEMGWKYNYRNLTSGVLNSIEKNEFDFQEKVLQNIKITIHNYDNETLKIGDIGAKAAVHYLTARFSKPARYYLVYGNPNANKPHYDIGHFSDKIPDNPTNLQVGEEKPIYKNNPPKTEALFKNKIWLWAVMAIVILLLGWFSISMIKKK